MAANRRRRGRHRGGPHGGDKLGLIREKGRGRRCGAGERGAGGELVVVSWPPAQQGEGAGIGWHGHGMAPVAMIGPVEEKRKDFAKTPLA